MTDSAPTIAYLTAGAAGMYCGSCLHDNTLASGLMKLGCDVHLIPTYTPLRTDEQDVSDHTVLMGGINVYLQERFPIFRLIPSVLDRWLDQPWLINWLASRGIETDAHHLGTLTTAMLKGERGPLRKEINRLVKWLVRHVKPDLINLSNILIGGCVPELKRRLGVPVLVTLQGDDLFLEGLDPPFKERAFEEIHRLAEHIDGYITFSEYYRDFMADYLDLPKDRFHLVPLGIKTDDFSLDGRPTQRKRRQVGYFARVCQEKGLHLLIDAFLQLRERQGFEDLQLQIAGWLGPAERPFFEEQRRRLLEAGLTEGEQADFYYAGAVDRHQKVEFLSQLDVLSVPTTYRDPKGLFVLEALASGVPVVQPDHGAFPELLAKTGGGRLFRAGDAGHLADTLGEALHDLAACRELGESARRNVHARFGVQPMAEATLRVYQQYLDIAKSPTK